MKKKMLLFAGAVLLSTALVVGAVYACSTTKAGKETKVVTKSTPTDYEQQAKEYIVKKYGEQLDNLWIANESNVSLPYSKVELWDCKIYFKNDNIVNGNRNGYYVNINKADNAISEKLQPFLDTEEKAVKEICWKLDKHVYEKVINLKGDETLDVEIVYNNSDTKPLQKRLNKLGVKIIDAPENWSRVYATVTKKQLKDVEAIKEVNLIELFYGYSTAQ